MTFKNSSSALPSELLSKVKEVLICCLNVDQSDLGTVLRKKVATPMALTDTIDATTGLSFANCV